METDGFYGLFIAPLSCLSLSPYQTDRRKTGRPTDRPTARTAEERGVSENLGRPAGELLSILTCRVPPSVGVEKKFI